MGESFPDLIERLARAAICLAALVFLLALLIVPAALWGAHGAVATLAIFSAAHLGYWWGKIER